MDNIEIIPAILATREQDYKDKLSEIESSGVFHGGWVHIDFADGLFVNNKTAKFSPRIQTSLKIEAHLMVNQPNTWAGLMAEMAERVILHLESPKIDLTRFTEVPQVGVAINPETAVSMILPFIDKVDVVVVMGVHPGFQGQEFIPEVIEKVKEAKSLRLQKNCGFRIGVDGGVSAENAKLIVDAGADYIIVGSYLFEGDVEKNVEKIWEAIKS